MVLLFSRFWEYPSVYMRCRIYPTFYESGLRRIPYPLLVLQHVFPRLPIYDRNWIAAPIGAVAAH